MPRQELNSLRASATHGLCYVNRLDLLATISIFDIVERC